MWPSPLGEVTSPFSGPTPTLESDEPLGGQVTGPKRALQYHCHRWNRVNSALEFLPIDRFCSQAPYTIPPMQQNARTLAFFAPSSTKNQKPSWQTEEVQPCVMLHFQ